jgi:hypothetical protein
VSGTQPRLTTQGMVTAIGFVQPSGDLTAVSFRFLFGLFNAVRQLEGQVTALQATVQTLQARQTE